jgi:hypothetical protein
MNTTNKLFTESLRPEQGDNRSYFVKALNQIIADGFISIEIAPKGKVWTNPNFKDSKGNLRDFNIQVKGYGWTGRYYDRDFNAKDLLGYVAKFIKNPSIIDLHVKSISLNISEVCECDRCMGQGFIKAFNYYCDGICFKCYGSKYMIQKRVLTV